MKELLAIFHRMVRVGLTERVTAAQSPKGDEGVTIGGLA